MISKHVKGRATELAKQETFHYSVEMVAAAAENLFDNRLGWERGSPWAPREVWADLGEALYGEHDHRVKELRSPPKKGQEPSVVLPASQLPLMPKEGVALCYESYLRAYTLAKTGGTVDLAGAESVAEMQAASLGVFHASCTEAWPPISMKQLVAQAEERKWGWA